MSSDSKEFLGQSVKFPIQVNEAGAVELVSRAELVKQSIFEVLAWPTRVKYFQEDYGTKLYNLLEEPDDAVTSALAKEYIREALNIFESRISKVQVRVFKSKTQPGKSIIQISYNILGLNLRDSLIYPFYQITNIIP